jgi:hypothetical protein
MKTKSLLLLSIIILISTSLLFIGKWAETVILFDTLPLIINKTLILTFFILLFLCLNRRHEFSVHFRKGDISAQFVPEPWIGLKPKSTENWMQIGRNLAIIITVVTCIIIFFQIISQYEINWESWLKFLPYVLVFSVVNSFVEEMITRFGVIVSLKGFFSDKIISFVSALLFGTIHFYGTPGGIAGVLFSGFLGWFLAKSIIETKGIFWAWLIHFLQDIVIFSAMVMIL